MTNLHDLHEDTLQRDTPQKIKGVSITEKFDVSHATLAKKLIKND
jgi:hypothetical protein